VSKTQSVPKVGWCLRFRAKDSVINRQLALETWSTRLRVSEASQFLLHLFADFIHSQNRQVYKAGRVRKVVSICRLVATGRPELPVRWDILCVGMGRVIVHTLALKFLTPITGLIAAASHLACLARGTVEFERVTNAKTLDGNTYQAIRIYFSRLRGRDSMTVPRDRLVPVDCCRFVEFILRARRLMGNGRQMDGSSGVLND
jgi:hypothetical protein